MRDSPASSPSTSLAYIRHTSTTMMSVAPQDFQSQPYYYLPYRPVSSPRHPQQQDISYFNFTNLNHSPTLDSATTAAMAAAAAANARSSQQDASVAQALEIARESPDGSSDPTISKILEGALARIWSKVTEHPDSYVMTRDEFAVFNFFQHRFNGNKMALNARKRFWDNTHA